jgi:hypothetical protein
VLTGIALVILVLAALLVQTPKAPAPPSQPVTVPGPAIVNDAQDLLTVETRQGRCCLAGSAAELAGAVAMKQEFANFDPKAHLVQFAANLPWRSDPVPMANVIAYSPGTQTGIVAVLARRDGLGVQPAAGSAMLIELSRALAPLKLQRGVVLASIDGGSTGGQGAARFARTWPLAHQIVATITLESVAGPVGAHLKLLLRSVAKRGTSPTLLAAIRQSTALVGGADPELPGATNQITGYAIPYAPTSQSPVLAEQIPAIGISAVGRPAPSRLKELEPAQLAQTASAIATLVDTLDAAPAIDQGGSPAVFVGESAVRGWLLELGLVMLLVPCLACVLLLVAKARRRNLPLRPGVVAMGWRISTWLVALITMWVVTLLPWRLLPDIADPPLPHRTGVTAAGVIVVILITAIYWRFVAHPRTQSRAGVTGADRTIGLTTGLLGLMLAGILLAAINPFVLIIIVPAAHAWLWLSETARVGRGGMAVPYLIGFAGLVLVLAELWFGQHLGWQTPRIVIAMAASGYLSPAVTFCLAIAGAAACQVGALVAGRYSPAVSTRFSQP